MAAGQHIYSLPVNLDTCAGQSELVVQGGASPDWGPADPGVALAATAPRRIRLAALLRGLTVRVSCSCTARATLRLAGRAIGSARKAVSGSARLKVKPNRAGKARLQQRR